MPYQSRGFTAGAAAMTIACTRFAMARSGSRMVAIFASTAASPSPPPFISFTRSFMAARSSAVNRAFFGAFLGLIARPSLSCRRLPQLDSIALGIHDPAEPPVLRVLDLLVDPHALGPQRREQAVQVMHAIVDHERRRAGREVLRVRGKQRPRGRAWTLPIERGAAPLLHVDAEVLLVPGTESLRILGLEEDATDAGHTLHD